MGFPGALTGEFVARSASCLHLARGSSPGRDDQDADAHTGRAQFVRDTRKAFQDAMRDEFVAEARPDSV
jgi:hypothetical protein